DDLTRADARRAATGDRASRVRAGARAPPRRGLRSHRLARGPRGARSPSRAGPPRGRQGARGRLARPRTERLPLQAQEVRDRRPVMLWLVAAALAQEPGLAEERLAVERAATAVAEARARGVSRGEIAELMAIYRDAAERLAAREAAEEPPVDLAVERLSALRALTDALAAGREALEARRALVAWLGEPAARMSLLEQALDA